MRPNILGFALAAVAAVAFYRTSLAIATFQVVVQSDQSAGAGNGTFLSSSDPLLNDLGRVAFQGNTNTPNYFLAIEGPESAHIVARDGLQAPDAPVGVTFQQLAFKSSLRQNNENQIAFTGDIAGPGINSSNDSGIWAGDPANLKLIVQTNDVAPGASGQRFASFDDNIGFGNGGFVGFIGTLQNNAKGIWAGADNNVQLVAMQGGPAPGLPGYQFTQFDPFGYSYSATNNNAQQVAFQATVKSSASIDGIWAGAPGAIQLVAYEGMPLTGFGSGAKVNYLRSPPQINDDNEVAFSAAIGPTGGPYTDGILLKTATGIAPIYQLNSAPPGLAAGTTFGTQLGFQLSDDRRMVFLNQVTLANSNQQQALFASDNGNLRLVARDGQQIPNAQGDLHFSVFDQYYINHQGRVAFMAGTAGDDAITGIWSEDASHQLFEVVRTGMQVQLAPGDIHTILDISWPDNQGGDFSPLLPFNSAGQIVFDASFLSGGDAILLYTPAAARVQGDYNQDGVVNAADYVVWRNSLNATGTGLAADGNSDSHVDEADYQIWRAHFGESAAAGAGTISLLAVPEPAATILILTAALFIQAHNRRRSRCLLGKFDG